MACSYARPPCPSPTPRVYSNSGPSSRWCHPAISSSVAPFSSHHQSFPASGSFSVIQFFASGGQSIGVSASASVAPVNVQGGFLAGVWWLYSVASVFLLYGKVNQLWKSSLLRGVWLVCDPLGCSQPGSSVRVDSPGKNTGAGCHALLMVSQQFIYFIRSFLVAYFIDDSLCLWLPSPCRLDYSSFITILW